MVHGGSGGVLQAKGMSHPEQNQTGISKMALSLIKRDEVRTKV